MGHFRRIRRGRRKHRKIYISLILWCIVSVVLLKFYINDMEEKTYMDPGPTVENFKINLSRNYFSPKEEFTNGKYIIDNDKCKVPDLDVWDEEVLPLLQIPPPPRCHQSEQITFVVNSEIIISEEEVLNLGYNLEDISCCYKTIERITQTRKKYDKNADNRYRYSDECYQMDRITTPKSGFVKVTCEVKAFIFLKRTIYEQFHAVPILPEERFSANGNKLSRKLSYWGDRLKDGKTQLPPNILVLGVDSTSRINFHRLMFRSIRVLNNVIKAVEIKGYTKVGESTLPNFIPFMTSISQDEFRNVCYPNSWVPLDDCPYIWKEFSHNNYLTALLEDSPRWAICNYLKTGFVKAPVDMYLRPFMLAAYEYYDSDSAYGKIDDCIGYKRSEKVIFDYIVNLAGLSKRRQIPYFIVSWLTDLSHNEVFNVYHMDQVLAETLLKLHLNKLLDNTLLFVMSDHGYRYQKIRATKTGWFEDKMPAMWMKLGPKISSLKPEWVEALNDNSRQLVTPFDMHHALRDILTTFSGLPSPIKDVNPKLLEIHKSKPKLRGLSPFWRLPLRTCKEAGVPRGFCPCIAPVAYDNAEFIELAATFFKNYVNSILPPLCEPINIESVVAFGILNQRLEGVGNAETLDGSPETSVMSLKTKPGDFHFEVWLHYDREKSNFTEIFDVLRMNSMGDTGSCVRVFDKYMELEKYCYCKYRHMFYSLVGNYM